MYVYKKYIYMYIILFGCTFRELTLIPKSAEVIPRDLKKDIYIDLDVYIHK